MQPHRYGEAVLFCWNGLNGPAGGSKSGTGRKTDFRFLNRRTEPVRFGMVTGAENTHSRIRSGLKGFMSNARFLPVIRTSAGIPF